MGKFDPKTGRLGGLVIQHVGSIHKIEYEVLHTPNNHLKSFKFLVKHSSPISGTRTR